MQITWAINLKRVRFQSHLWPPRHLDHPAFLKHINHLSDPHHLSHLRQAQLTHLRHLIYLLHLSHLSCPSHLGHPNRVTSGLSDQCKSRRSSESCEESWPHAPSIATGPSKPWVIRPYPSRLPKTLKSSKPCEPPKPSQPVRCPVQPMSSELLKACGPSGPFNSSGYISHLNYVRHLNWKGPWAGSAIWTTQATWVIRAIWGI